MRAPGWQRVPVASIAMPNRDREAALATGYAIFYVGLAYLTGLVILRHPAPLLGAASFTQDAWYVFAFKIGGLLVVPLAAFAALGHRPAELLAGWRFRPGSIAWIAIAIAAGGALNLGHLAGIRAALSALPPARASVVLIAAVLLPLFSAALPEEIFFRAILQTRLEGTVGRVGAIALSVLLFAAWHLPTRWLLSEGVEGRHGDLASVLLGTGVPVMIVGLVFALLWDRYRSLPALIAAHWAIDFLPSLSSLLGIHR